MTLLDDRPAASAPAVPPVRPSVVVCAYTLARRDVLLEGLAALRGQTLAPYEVVVVSDGNLELAGVVAGHLQEVGHDGVRVVLHDGPRGLSGARNAGVAASTGDVVVFLDDDAVPEPDCLERLLAPFADPDVAVVGGRAVPRWRGPEPAWLPAEFLWTVGCSYTGQPTELAEVRNPLGCLMAVRREVFEHHSFRVGAGRSGSDAAGCEETELCVELRQRDPRARVLLEPAAVVSHVVDPDRGSWSYFLRRCRGEGRSKAALARLRGADDALSSERAYVNQVLPRAVLSGLRDGLHGDPWGPARSAAVALGTARTATSYAAVLAITPARRSSRGSRRSMSAA